MASAKKNLRKFLKHIAHAPVGAMHEVGLTWDKQNGWRVYERVGEMGLALSPRDARNLSAVYEKLAASPEYRGVKTGLEQTLGLLRPLADEAEQKNTDKVIPDNAAEFLPAEGRA